MSSPSRLVVVCLAALFPLAALLPAAGRDADELKPLTFKGRGTLKGKVIVEGEPHGTAEMTKGMLNQMKMHMNAGCCLAGKGIELEQQVWRIGKKGGLANVVVAVRPAAGYYFPLTKDDLTPKKGGWRKDVTMDQPHCAFVPHVAVLFPSYYDGRTGKQVATGQVFTVKNRATVSHNFKWSSPKNDGGNQVIAAGGNYKPKVKPDRYPISVGCNIHPWMTAYLFAFDHPFATVSDQDGNFEIKNVPAGMPLELIAWHEAEQTGWLNKNGSRGEKITIPVNGAKVVTFRIRLKK